MRCLDGVKMTLKARSLELRDAKVKFQARES